MSRSSYNEKKSKDFKKIGTGLEVKLNLSKGYFWYRKHNRRNKSGHFYTWKY